MALTEAELAALAATVAGRIGGTVLGRERSGGTVETEIARAAITACDAYAAAPADILREASIRLAGWMYGNQPHVTEHEIADPSGTAIKLRFAGMATGNGLRFSGASALLSRYVVRRGGGVGSATEDDDMRGAASPLTLSQVQEAIAGGLETALAPVLARLGVLEGAAGVTPRLYVGYTGWSDDETIDASDFSAGVTFRDGQVGTPAGGPGYFWFAVPVAQGYPDRIIMLGFNQSGGFAEQAPVVFNGAGYIVGRTNAALGSFFPGDPPTELEYD